jgi:hydrogenase-4 component F
MDASFVLIALITVPAAAALTCLLVPSPRAILRLIAGTAVAVGVLALLTAVKVFSGGALIGAGDWLRLDALGAFHFVVMTSVFVISSLFASAYFSGPNEQVWFTLRLARRYGALWLGSMAAMSLVLVSNNLAIQWVAIEATTLLTAFLICMHTAPSSLEATWKYLVMCSVGVAFAFMGLLLLVASAGQRGNSGGDALLWTHMVGVAASLDPNLVKAAFIFLLVGYGTKVGLAPMHTWLPDAHSQAPAPVSALFSGFLLNAALYCLARYLPIVDAATGRTGWAAHLMQIFGLASIVLAAAFIVFQRDLKRLLAYSSMEHLGIVALGLGLGPAGAFAAMFHTLNHSLGKSVAFFAAGRLGQTFGSHEMANLSGSLRQSPAWGAALFAALLALVGAAPFAFFMSELQVLKAAADGGETVVLVLFLIGLAVAFIGALRHVIAMAWGDPRPPATVGEIAPSLQRAGLLEIGLAVIPLGALLVLGVWLPNPLRQALDQAVRALGGAT